MKEEIQIVGVWVLVSEVSKVVIAVSEENNISICGVRQSKLSQP
jgi:hypothetical protein